MKCQQTRMIFLGGFFVSWPFWVGCVVLTASPSPTLTATNGFAHSLVERSSLEKLQGSWVWRKLCMFAFIMLWHAKCGSWRHPCLFCCHGYCPNKELSVCFLMEVFFSSFFSSGSQSSFKSPLCYHWRSIGRQPHILSFLKCSAYIFRNVGSASEWVYCKCK